MIATIGNFSCDRFLCAPYSLIRITGLTITVQNRWKDINNVCVYTEMYYESETDRVVDRERHCVLAQASRRICLSDNYESHARDLERLRLIL